MLRVGITCLETNQQSEEFIARLSLHNGHHVQPVIWIFGESPIRDWHTSPWPRSHRSLKSSEGRSGKCQATASTENSLLVMLVLCVHLWPSWSAAGTHSWLSARLLTFTKGKNTCYRLSCLGSRGIQKCCNPAGWSCGTTHLFTDSDVNVRICNIILQLSVWTNVVWSEPYSNTPF